MEISLYDIIGHNNEVMDDDVMSVFLESGRSIVINAGAMTKMNMTPSESTVDLIGERETIVGVSLDHVVGDSIKKIALLPKESIQNARYLIEPVVEFCMQNQRLRSASKNGLGIDTGVDILSSQNWSPGDNSIIHGNKEHWIQPYLDGDISEWTDMTGHPLEKESVMLPDNKWIWANEWSVEIPSGYGDCVDADGWEYADDFKSFGFISRFYEGGNMCRRRRWTRTRMMKPFKLDERSRPLSIVCSSSSSNNGDTLVQLRSPIVVKNLSQSELAIFGCSESWRNDVLLSPLNIEGEFLVPVQFSCMTHIRIAIEVNVATSSYSQSDPILILSNIQSESVIQSCINLDDDEALELNLPSSLHFTVNIKHSKAGCTEITINPILRVENLLPCSVQFRLCEGAIDRAADPRGIDSLFLQELSLETGMKSSSVAVDPTLNPYVSFRVPGYRWSQRQRIVNRKFALKSWTPNEEDESRRFKYFDSNIKREEYTTTVQFDRLIYGGDPLTLLLEVVPGDCPLLRIFAQYWIIDKTGFGLRFCDGTGDLLGNHIKIDSPRRSYLLREEMQNRPFLEDTDVEGHEWTIGRDGMTIFFSGDSKMALSIDNGNDMSYNRDSRQIQSTFSDLLDISNVIPKAVFSSAELQGKGKFDLSYDVTLAPSIFSRTKVVTIYNRFNLVNLSGKTVYVAQASTTNATPIPPNSTVPFHWESRDLECNVRFSTDAKLWTPGILQLDKVGITALRIPSDDAFSMVIQIEVRLAKDDHDAAVVVLIWFANDQTNPLYLLRNKSSYEILCKQSHEEALADENNNGNSMSCGNVPLPHVDETWNTKTFNMIDFVSNQLNCGLIEKEIDHEPNKYLKWHLMQETSKYFGFDDPNKSHVIEWTFKNIHTGVLNSGYEKVDIDALGSSSFLSLPSGRKIGCIVRAEHSTKVIEFFDVQDDNYLIENIKDRLTHHTTSLTENQLLATISSNEEDFPTFTFNFNIVGICLSIIENSIPEQAGREMFLVYIDKTTLQVSQTRDGYHEIELKVLSVQIDNHVPRATTHVVMVSYLNNHYFKTVFKLILQIILLPMFH